MAVLYIENVIGDLMYQPLLSLFLHRRGWHMRLPWTQSVLRKDDNQSVDLYKS